jgi:hypothetical protein
MSEKSKKAVFKGKIQTRANAKGLLVQPGDFVVVEREIPRLMILRCPCGCGDDLLINLDRRSGPAWRLYIKSGKFTLSPSYWRDSACGSHFIIWENQVYWCSNDWDFDTFWSINEEIEDEILSVLNDQEFTHYMDIADQLDANPWDCLQACKRLNRRGVLTVKDGKTKEYFKKM